MLENITSIDYWHIVTRPVRGSESKRGTIIGGSVNYSFAKQWAKELAEDMPEFNVWVIHKNDY